jgi:hypothetical protein
MLVLLLVLVAARSKFLVSTIYLCGIPEAIIKCDSCTHLFIHLLAWLQFFCVIVLQPCLIQCICLGSSRVLLSDGIVSIKCVAEFDFAYWLLLE